MTPTAASTVDLTGPASVAAGAVSGAFTLEAREANGTSMTVAADEVFALTSNSTGTFQFWANADGSGVITSVTITNGNATATFYYTDNTTGTWTITADDAPTVEGAALGSDTHLIIVL
ncbi:MAG: hypothetical protein HY560_14050 [Gemmatimonadetes bacterium]|nr:hypothetical protein [Gemmatimonadota bacterium]